MAAMVLRLAAAGRRDGESDEGEEVVMARTEERGETKRSADEQEKVGCEESMDGVGVGAASFSAYSGGAVRDDERHTSKEYPHDDVGRIPGRGTWMAVGRRGGLSGMDGGRRRRRRGPEAEAETEGRGEGRD